MKLAQFHEEYPDDMEIRDAFNRAGGALKMKLQDTGKP